MEVGLSNAVVRSEGPPFEVGEGAMDPRKDDVGGHRADDVWLVIVVLESLVGREAVADDGRASFNGAGDEVADADG